ncbi:MAG: 50S ribosomal protein L4 [Verrucomicrobiota bacterium]|nr:50S ribosomal protein L4 [Verrucomicrobiota bacterium]
MVAVKKYDLSGKEIGALELDDALLDVKAHPQSVKDYLVAIRNNARQWSASTKTRAEINRTGRKPHPQKGGGRSRQGDLAAPQYKGGGIVFGPRPKFDQHVRINRKERRAAIAALIAEKVRESRLHILAEEEMEAPRTKQMAQFFRQREINGRSALVLGILPLSAGGENLKRSLNNLPKKEFIHVPQLNGYLLARSQELIVLESAWGSLLSMLQGGACE